MHTRIFCLFFLVLSGPWLCLSRRGRGVEGGKGGGGGRTVRVGRRIGIRSVYNIFNTFGFREGTSFI